MKKIELNIPTNRKEAVEKTKSVARSTFKAAKAGLRATAYATAGVLMMAGNALAEKEQPKVVEKTEAHNG